MDIRGVVLYSIYLSSKYGLILRYKSLHNSEVPLLDNTHLNETETLEFQILKLKCIISSVIGLESLSKFLIQPTRPYKALTAAIDISYE